MDGLLEDLDRTSSLSLTSILMMVSGIKDGSSISSCSSSWDSSWGSVLMTL
jgi:hypothetical protein